MDRKGVVLDYLERCNTYAEESIRQALENFKRVQSVGNPLNEVRRGNMY